MVIKQNKFPRPQKICIFWFLDFQIKIELIKALINLIDKSETKEVVKLICLLIPIAITAYVIRFKTNDMLVCTNPITFSFFILVRKILNLSLKIAT